MKKILVAYRYQIGIGLSIAVVMALAWFLPLWIVLCAAVILAAWIGRRFILSGLRCLGERVSSQSPLAIERWQRDKFETSSALSAALEEIVREVHIAFEAETVELRLEDGSGGAMHSSIVIGLPVTSQGENEDRSRVLKEDLVFAGETLGVLSLRLPEGRRFPASSRAQLRQWGLHSLMAILNARYAGELIRMRRESDMQSKARSGFLANLSHELRGPIGIILNASELVLEGLCGHLTDDQRETLGMVRLNSEHLMELINDVLDYARAESGTVQPKPVTLDVSEQMIELVKMVRAQADAKNHTLRCREFGAGYLVLCDRRHFRQMVLNLLTNAIKYTPDEGNIEIWAEPYGNSALRICVRDTGVGIHPDDRERVFAPFERLDDPYSIEQRGTGLGLSLTTKLAELNNGTVDFVSNYGAGTTFWVELPQVGVAEKVEAPNPVAMQAPQNAQILLVQPGEEERVLIARYLRSLGYEVHLAMSEAAARQLLRREAISLVLLTDLFENIGQGPLAGFVRQEERRGHIPVVLLTRSAFLVDVERFLREEVDRCLAKPVRLEELAVACRQAIEFSSAEAN